MKKEKLFLIILSLAIVATLIIIVYDYNKTSSQNNQIYNKQEEGISNDYDSDKKDNYTGKKENNSLDTEKQASFSEQTTSSESLKEDNLSSDNLPKDIDESPCGFYSGDYELCGGYCETGVCISEERSCYCKE